MYYRQCFRSPIVLQIYYIDMSKTKQSSDEKYERPTPFQAERGDTVRVERPEEYKLLFESETHSLYKHTGIGTVFLFERSPSIYPEIFQAQWNPRDGDMTVQRPLRDVDGTFFPTRNEAEKVIDGRESSLTDIISVERIRDDSMIVQLKGLDYGDDPAVVVLN